MAKPAAFGFAFVETVICDMVSESTGSARVIGSCSNTVSKRATGFCRCGFGVKSLSGRFDTSFASLVFLDEHTNELLGAHELLGICDDFAFASPNEGFGI